MFWYKLDSKGYIDSWTNNKKYASTHGYELSSEFEPVMQGDGSGYVLPVDYVAPARSLTSKTMVEQLTEIANKQAVIEETINELLLDGTD